ncbi:TPA: hypothetical protein ACGGRP_004443 [Escherichia coli]
MDDKKLKALAAELAKGLKTEAALNQFYRLPFNIMGNYLHPSFSVF